MIELVILQRKSAMDSVEKALDARGVLKPGDEPKRILKAAMLDLEGIAAQLRAFGASPLEVCKTLRYLGSVRSDLAQVEGPAMLLKARAAYVQAEAELAKQPDILEGALLDFNFANTLRAIDRNSRELLDEAMARAESARAVFSAQAPRYMPQADELIHSIRNLLRLQPLAAHISNGGDLKGILGAFNQVFDDLPAEATADPRHAQTRAALDQLGRKVADADESPEGKILEALMARLAADEKAGTVSAARAQSLRMTLSKLPVGGGADLSMEELLNRQAQFLQVSQRQIDRLRDMRHPGLSRPPAGSVAAILAERLWPLRRYLAENQLDLQRGHWEKKAAWDLDLQGIELDRQLCLAGRDDATAREWEQEGLQPFAQAVRDFSGRHHLMAVKPKWSNGSPSIDPKAVFFSGHPKVSAMLAKACAERGMRIQETPPGDQYAQARFRQLQQSAIAVFDLTAGRGTGIAAACFDAGMAMVLGKPMVMLSNASGWLPFDLAVPPTRLPGDESDPGILGDALDQAMYWFPAEGKRNRRTVDHLLAAHPSPAGEAGLWRKQVAALGEGADPLDQADHARKFLEFLGDGRSVLVRSNFPPAYPVPGRRKLFHVLPIGRHWAETLSATAQRICEAQGVQYLRGDHDRERDIMGGIWDGISTASHILVDLTDFSPNVALEAGIAEALGRPVLLAGQKRAIENLAAAIPMLTWTRVAGDGSETRLADSITAFLRE
jgi:hypothetical protein